MSNITNKVQDKAVDIKRETQKIVDKAENHAENAGDGHANIKNKIEDTAIDVKHEVGKVTDKIKNRVNNASDDDSRT